MLVLLDYLGNGDKGNVYTLGTDAASVAECRYGVLVSEQTVHVVH